MEEKKEKEKEEKGRTSEDAHGREEDTKKRSGGRDAEMSPTKFSKEKKRKGMEGRKEGRKEGRGKGEFSSC